MVGGGSIDPDGTFALSFNVRSGPSGENPTGELSVLVRPGGPMLSSSSISCVVVNGSSASFAGTFLPNPDGYTDFQINVQDTGSTGSPDLLGLIFTTNTPQGCTYNLVKGTLTTGGLVVTDAQPLPTLKDQCKNGGWRDYGSLFKNQGACVSFVATGGKKKK